MPYNSAEGDLTSIFVSDYDVIDRAVATGSLWGSGINSYGQLGTNDTQTYSSPVQTTAYGTNWKQLSIGQNHIQAIYFNNAGFDYPSIVS